MELRLEVYDDRLPFMAMADAHRLDDALRREDGSDAWIVWSDAADGALVDAFCFAGPCSHQRPGAWARRCTV